MDPVSQNSDWFGDGRKYVHRLIYIGDTLYTISEGFVKAHDLETLQQINSVNL